MLALPLRGSTPELYHGKYIAGMFGSGEQGAWFDPSDLSTLYQDAAGTTPVTAVEQPVGRMLDKSGRGNHATQATTTSRPTLKQDASGKYYLSFDGVDDYLSTGSIDFTATDKMTVMAGARAFDGHIYNTIVAQNYPNSPGWYHLLKRNLPSELNIENSRRGSGSNAFTNTPNDFGGLYDGNIVTAYAFDLARTPELVTQRVNGAVKINRYGIDSGVGPLANAPLYIGSINATQHRLTGRLYGLIVRGAATDDLHLTNAEKFLAYKSGVTL